MQSANQALQVTLRALLISLKSSLEIFIQTFFPPPFIAEFSNALRMIEVRVPNYTVKDNTVKLECHYDMEDEKLYSVKWYKDGHEFYRYLPRDHPPATLFLQNGMSVDVSREVHSKPSKKIEKFPSFPISSLAPQLFRLTRRPELGYALLIRPLSMRGFRRGSELQHSRWLRRHGRRWYVSAALEQGFPVHDGNISRHGSRHNLYLRD
jgi:hypothetical protein